MNLGQYKPSAVLASAAAGFEDFVSSLGGDADRVIGEAGLSAEDLREPTNAISLSAYCDLLDSAAALTKNPNFGLHYGRDFTPEMFGLIGFIALASPTAWTALGNFIELFPLHQSRTETRLRAEDGLIRMEYRIVDAEVRNKRHDAEFTLAAFANVARRAFGRNWAPVRVEFEHADNGLSCQHEGLFDAEVAFSQQTNALIFRPERLDARIATGNSHLLSTLCASLRALRCGEGMKRQDLLARMRSAIRAGLPGGKASLQDIADEFRIPAWTFQRRLSDAGVTFSDFVEVVRRDLAEHYIQDPNITVTEMAFLLGYSETSAFSRAFRKWHGVSPRQVRGSLQRDDVQ